MENPELPKIHEGEARKMEEDSADNANEQKEAPKEFDQEKLHRQATQIIGRMLDNVGDINSMRGRAVNIKPGIVYLSKEDLDSGYLEALKQAVVNGMNEIMTDPEGYAELALGAKRDENGQFREGTMQIVKESQKNLREASRDVARINIETEKGPAVVWERPF